ncbi:MAG: penicillin-binding protein 2 [Gallionellaceae bacterium]|nr:penicillin-binding protein 2 [Gallionellaceae bacterium]
MRRKGMLPRELQRWRMRVVMTLVFAGFGVLTARAAYLQGWQDDFLARQGELRIQRVLEIPAHRGMITDRRGEPLAISTPVESVWLNPAEAEASPAQIEALARRLGLAPRGLKSLFADKARSFVYLKRQLPPEAAAAALALGIKGVHATPEYRRYYPAGEVMGQVLGVTGVDDRGLEGLEFAYQDQLAGRPGAQRVARDRLGNVIEVIEQLRPPKHGEDLTLSINLQLQYLAYRELAAAVAEHKARAGALVVLDAHTGEVLAMVSVPSYNPNNRASMSRSGSRNRVVADVFEPGSTMKPFVVAAALESGTVTPETRIDTGPGWLMVGEKRIADVHPKGEIDIGEAIKVSSNVAAARIALDMKSADYWAVLRRAGFGTPPGAGFPGEAAGRLRHYETWRPIEKATMAYGHGLSASLLQLARAYCVFAGDGVLPGLTVMKRDAAVAGERVLSATTARTLRKMMEQVTQEGGTAPRARVMGYRVAGKTGTAHKADKGGYAADKYIASFVGLAPVSAPRLVAAVMIDEPSGDEYYGGQVAAPVFAKVMAGALRFMAIAPDAPLEDLPAPGTVVGEAT